MFPRPRSFVATNPPAFFEPLEPRQLMAAHPTDLDLSFSGDGKVVTDFGGANDVAHAVAVQSDGKIVVAGETQLTVNGVKKTAFAAVRFNPDGSLDDGGSKDTTKGDKFGTGGKFTRVLDQGGGTGAIGVAIQKDGKIILAGNANKSATLPEWYFVRLNKDGTPDSGYGTKGVRVTDFAASLHPHLNAIVLQPDGKLVAAGDLEGDCTLIRLTTTGQPDITFDNRGQRGLDFGTPQTITALAIDNLGRILLTANIKGNTDIGVARLLNSGLEDPDFGNNGRVSGFTLSSVNVGAITVEPSGDILLGVAFQDPHHTREGAAVLLDSHGRFLGASSTKGRTSANGLTVNGADDAILGGTSINNGAPESFYVEDLNTSGINNIGFGSKTDHNVASAMAIGSDGKIVQVGSTTAGGGGRNFAIARYLGTPTSKLGAISGNVFLDTDRDGVKDPNETGLSGRHVFIDANNNGVFDLGIERSVLTDANGNYKLFIAPGTYHVRTSLPDTLHSVLPPATPGVYTVNVTAKKTISGIDFDIPAAAPPRGTRIVGSVFFDFNSSGLRNVQNPTEPDRPNQTVFLDTNGNSVLDAGEPQTKTDAGGNYAFNNLTPGQYRIGNILPAGWVHVPDDFFAVTVDANETIVRNFAETFADPDDRIAEVDQRPANQVKVGGSASFSIDNVTDVDLVRFTATKGQRVSFDVDHATGSSLNSFLRLFDANGNQLASNDDAAAPGEGKSSDSFLAFTFAKAGNYYIGVSNNANKAYLALTGQGDNGVGSTGAYKLSLANVPTAASRALGDHLFSNMFIRPQESRSNLDVI